jgi:hypothetical protein
LECWNAGILGKKERIGRMGEKMVFDLCFCFMFFLTHYSIIPVFHHPGLSVTHCSIIPIFQFSGVASFHHQGLRTV